MGKHWKQAVFAAALLAPAGWAYWFLAPPGRPFDAAAWHSADALDTNPRSRMADRLLAENALLGLTRAEVIVMLGDPETGYCRDWDMAYRLGPERGLIALDDEWLVLRLSGDGRVADARLVTR